MIIRQDLLTTNQDLTVPLMLDYKTFSNNNSLYNTPPTFAIYVAGLVFKWLLNIGGLDEIQKVNETKAKKLYDAIQNSNGFYKCPVQPKVQSKMNIPWRIYTNGKPNPELETQFLKEAESYGLMQLKGHRSVGGIRASLYNAMSIEGVDALVDFLNQFLLNKSS